MKYLILLLLSGCAVTGQSVQTKSNEHILIECGWYASGCFNRANMICPNGYIVEDEHWWLARTVAIRVTCK